MLHYRWLMHAGAFLYAPIVLRPCARILLEGSMFTLTRRPTDNLTILSHSPFPSQNGIAVAAPSRPAILVDRRHWRVVNVTSLASITGAFGRAKYSGDKAGIVGLTKSLADEPAQQNIPVNALAPLGRRTEAEGRSQARRVRHHDARAEPVAEVDGHRLHRRCLRVSHVTLGLISHRTGAAGGRRHLGCILSKLQRTSESESVRDRRSPNALPAYRQFAKSVIITLSLSNSAAQP
jgi:hypothetical protein